MSKIKRHEKEKLLTSSLARRFHGKKKCGEQRNLTSRDPQGVILEPEGGGDTHATGIGVEDPKGGPYEPVLPIVLCEKSG